MQRQFASRPIMGLQSKRYRIIYSVWYSFNRMKFSESAWHKKLSCDCQRSWNNEQLIVDLQWTLTSLLRIQVLLTRFSVLHHNLLVGQSSRCIGLCIQILLSDGVTYCWFDAIRRSWRVLIGIGCTSWIANIEKRFIVSRWRYSLTIKIKPSSRERKKSRRNCMSLRVYIGRMAVTSR